MEEILACLGWNRNGAIKRKAQTAADGKLAKRYLIIVQCSLILLGISPPQLMNHDGIGRNLVGYPRISKSEMWTYLDLARSKSTEVGLARHQAARTLDAVALRLRHNSGVMVAARLGRYTRRAAGRL